MTPKLRFSFHHHLFMRPDWLTQRSTLVKQRFNRHLLLRTWCSFWRCHDHVWSCNSYMQVLSIFICETCREYGNTSPRKHVQMPCRPLYYPSWTMQMLFCRTLVIKTSLGYSVFRIEPSALFSRFLVVIPPHHFYNLFTGYLWTRASNLRSCFIYTKFSIIWHQFTLATVLRYMFLQGKDCAQQWTPHASKHR